MVCGGDWSGTGVDGGGATVRSLLVGCPPLTLPQGILRTVESDRTQLDGMTSLSNAITLLPRFDSALTQRVLPSNNSIATLMSSATSGGMIHGGSLDVVQVEPEMLVAILNHSRNWSHKGSTGLPIIAGKDHCHQKNKLIQRQQQQQQLEQGAQEQSIDGYLPHEAQYHTQHRLARVDLAQQVEEAEVGDPSPLFEAPDQLLENNTDDSAVSITAIESEGTSPRGDVEGLTPDALLASAPSVICAARIESRPLYETVPTAVEDLTPETERPLESLSDGEPEADNTPRGSVVCSDDVESRQATVTQTTSSNVKKFVFHCSEGECGFSSGHRDRFVTHLRCLHHLRVDERVLDFNDWTAFTTWKERLERETHASFVKPHPSHRVQYYQQQNLESQLFHCAWLERSKQLYDSSKWRPCIGHLVVRRSVHSGRVSVYCVLSHYGHPTGPGSQSVPIDFPKAKRSHQLNDTAQQPQQQKMACSPYSNVVKNTTHPYLISEEESNRANLILLLNPTLDAELGDRGAVSSEQMLTVKENHLEASDSFVNRHAPSPRSIEEKQRVRPPHPNSLGTFVDRIESDENAGAIGDNSNYTIPVDARLKNGCRIIKEVMRPIPIERRSTEKVFSSQRESDVELDSDFSMEDSEDEENWDRVERFKTVLHVIRREGRIVHEKMRVHINNEVDDIPSSFPRSRPNLTSSVRRSHFTCTDCSMTGVHMTTTDRAEFIRHLIRTHSIRPEENIYMFQNLANFIAFKARMESTHRCAFVLRRKRCNELLFECSRSGRYRGENNARCASWVGASAQSRRGQIQKPQSRCIARMVVVRSGSDKAGLLEANVCLTHYGHVEDGERLNLSRRIALRVAQMASNSAKSSRQIFQTLAGSAGLRALSRDSVKSVIGFMRRHAGKFDYSAWQRELFNDYCCADNPCKDSSGSISETVIKTTQTYEGGISFTEIGYDAARITTDGASSCIQRTPNSNVRPQQAAPGVVSLAHMDYDPTLETAGVDDMALLPFEGDKEEGALEFRSNTTSTELDESPSVSDCTTSSGFASLTDVSSNDDSLFVGRESQQELTLVGGNDSDWEASSEGSCETMSGVEDHEMIHELDKEQEPIVTNHYDEKSINSGPPLHMTAESRAVRSVKGNIIVINGRGGSSCRPEECVLSVNARQTLREEHEAAHVLQSDEGESSDVIAHAEVTNCRSCRVPIERVPCEDLVGDKMAGVLIENEEVASDLLREILDEERLVLVARQSGPQPCPSRMPQSSNSVTGSNNNSSTISNSNTTTTTTHTTTTSTSNNSNSSSGNNSSSSSSNQNSETTRNQSSEGGQGNSNGTSTGGTNNNTENESSVGRGQSGQTATAVVVAAAAAAKEKTVAVGKIIEARLKDTLHLSDQEQALKRSIEQAIFTNPVRYEPPRVLPVPTSTPTNVLNRKGSSSEEESSEGEQPEVEPPPPPPPKPSKANTKFGKALASAQRQQQQQQQQQHSKGQFASNATKNSSPVVVAEKRKITPTPGHQEEGPQSKVATVIRKTDELTEAQRAHEYRDRLMGVLHSPAVIKLPVSPVATSVVKAHGSAISGGSPSPSTGGSPLSIIHRHDPKAPSPSGSTPHGKKKLAVQATDRNNQSNKNK